MALIFGDGFDYYSTAQLLQKWDQQQGCTLSSLYGRFGGQGMRSNGGFDILGQGGLSKNLPAVNASYGFFGQAVFVPAMPTGGNYNIVALYDPAGGTAMHIAAMLGADGSVAVGFKSINNFTSSLTTLARSAPGLISAGTWYYIEVKVKIHVTSGYMEILVNGTSAITYSGNTVRGSGFGAGITYSAANYFTHVKLGGTLDTVGGEPMYFDDFYYCDDTGTVNNTYLGDIQLQAIFPNGAGSSTDWVIAGTTPATTNWQSVNEPTANDDVTFVKTVTVGAQDLYEMDNLNANATDVKGLLVNARIKKDAGTVRTYSTMVKDVAASGAPAAVAVRTVPSSVYVNQQDVSQVSPTTGVAWTVAGVNAIEVGIKLIT